MSNISNDLTQLRHDTDEKVDKTTTDMEDARAAFKEQADPINVLINKAEMRVDKLEEANPDKQRTWQQIKRMEQKMGAKKGKPADTMLDQGAGLKVPANLRNSI